MVARLSVAKDRATESSTTHTLSASQDEPLSDFVAQPLESHGIGLQNENRDDNLGTFSSGEVLCGVFTLPVPPERIWIF